MIDQFFCFNSPIVLAGKLNFNTGIDCIIHDFDKSTFKKLLTKEISLNQETIFKSIHSLVPFVSSLTTRLHTWVNKNQILCFCWVFFFIPINTKHQSRTYMYCLLSNKSYSSLFSFSLSLISHHISIYFYRSEQLPKNE